MITPYVPLVLRENLEKVGNPDTKKSVGNKFVSARLGRVGQKCRLLAVVPTCRRHVGDFPSQVPPERRLLWRTAPTATKIHRPSPSCAAGCGRITSCRGVHRGGGGRERASEMNNRVNNKMWSESSGDYLASCRPLR